MIKQNSLIQRRKTFTLCNSSTLSIFTLCILTINCSEIYFSERSKVSLIFFLIVDRLSQNIYWSVHPSSYWFEVPFSQWSIISCNSSLFLALGSFSLLLRQRPLNMPEFCMVSLVPTPCHCLLVPQLVALFSSGTHRAPCLGAFGQAVASAWHSLCIQIPLLLSAYVLIIKESLFWRPVLAFFTLSQNYIHF